MTDEERKSKKINDIIDDILDEIREEFQSMTPGWFYDKPTSLREEQDYDEPEKGCLCPLVDLQDRADSYHLIVSLPMVKDKQLIELEANYRSLTIKAKIKTPVVIHDFGPFSHSYRTCDSFYRHIYLPDIDPESIEAKFSGGILELNIQKKRRKHRIHIT